MVLNILLMAVAARGLMSRSRDINPSNTELRPTAGEGFEASDPKPAPSFRWSQLESINYFTYVANLRAIGCPEQTVRDILSADVDSLYARRRAQLDDQQTRSGQNLAARRNELDREESNVIACFLGLGLNRNNGTAKELAPAAGNGIGSDSQARSHVASMPIAFVDLDTNCVQLNERQEALIARLRQSFTEELGGGTMDPASPEYAERWRNAQPEYDEMLEVMLGREAYVEFQRQAARPRQDP